jgi:hypothetical protein
MILHGDNNRINQISFCMVALRVKADGDSFWMNIKKPDRPVSPTAWSMRNPMLS